MTERAQDPTVSIVVISYNTRDLTLACLRSVYEQTRTPFELIVVDNASSDGSVEAIEDAFPKELYPNLRLLPETRNHGFGPAHEIALAHMRSDWLLLLNPDTVVLDQALDRLLTFAEEEPNAGIWGGRTVFADGNLNPYSCWHRMTLWTVFCRTSGLTGLFPRSELFNTEQYGAWPRDRRREVDIVTGCLFLTRRETWEKLGGFSPEFFMYGEEADLCLRSKAIGLRPMITPEATIVHYGAASEPVAADRVVRVLRAKAELIHRHFANLERQLGLRLFVLYPLTRWLGNGVLSYLTRRSHFTQRTAVWSEVWLRRSEWRHGFLQPPSSAVSFPKGPVEDGKR